MSLSWRKRQALQSDQQSWRGLGVDSALWTSIDRNAANVKTAVGGSGASTTGIVTDIKFTRTGVLNGLTSGSQIIYVSDPCNNAIVATSGINKFDTIMDASHTVLGNGLAFNISNFGSAGNTIVGQDISGMKVSILDGGSGYSVGQTFSMANTGPFTGEAIGQITGVTKTAPQPGLN